MFSYPRCCQLICLYFSALLEIMAVLHLAGTVGLGNIISFHMLSILSSPHVPHVSQSASPSFVVEFTVVILSEYFAQYVQ
jgi:hypothetical protein